MTAENIQIAASVAGAWFIGGLALWILFRNPPRLR